MGHLHSSLDKVQGTNQENGMLKDFVGITAVNVKQN